MKKENTSVIDSSSVLEIIKFNTGRIRFNANLKKKYFDSKMAKSQLIQNIAITLQFFTGLRINEIAKLEFSQLELLSKKKPIKVVLSKLKNRVVRNIAINPTLKSGQLLYKQLIKMLKSFLQLNQDFLVVSKNMNSKKTIIKKKNGKTYETSFFPYISYFLIGVNSVLKRFVEKKDSENDSFLPSHIEKMTSHGFRNNFIVTAYKSFGNDLVRTQKLIGHYSIDMTSKYIYKYLSSQDGMNFKFAI